MSEGNAETFRSEDAGMVVDIDNPEGISWLEFAGIAFDGQYEVDIAMADLEPHRTVPVPVSTDSLTAAKNDIPVLVGDLFFTDVNLDAISPADVDPLAKEYFGSIYDTSPVEG